MHVPAENVQVDSEQVPHPVIYLSEHLAYLCIGITWAHSAADSEVLYICA